MENREQEPLHVGEKAPRDRRTSRQGATPGSAWHRWGLFVARHRRATLAVWALALAGSATLYPSLKGQLGQPNYTIDGSESSRVESLLGGTGFRGAGNEQDAIVFFSARHRARDRAYRAQVERVLRFAHLHAAVAAVADPYGQHVSHPQISADEHAAVAPVALIGDTRQRYSAAADLQAGIARIQRAGVHAWLTGNSPIGKDIVAVESTDSERGERIGVPLALLVMVLALGAVGAALVPLALAGSGMLLTFGAVVLLGKVFSFDAFMLTVVTMVGVGIGIDYSLFIVSRFREELARLPDSPRSRRRRNAQAVGVALATSGRTILYSGAIVALSLTSLLIVRAPIFREFVIGIDLCVVCALAAALTLLPAVLAHLGGRINAVQLPRRLRPANVQPDAVDGVSGWARWSLAMMRRPLVVALAVSLVLLGATLPLTGLRTGIAIDLPSLSGTPSGEGAKVLARYFGAGTIAPLQMVLIDGPSSAPGASADSRRMSARTGPLAARWLAGELQADRRVAEVSSRAYPAGVLLTVAPSVPIDSAAAAALVRGVRSKLAPAVRRRYGARLLVGGWSAQALDASNESTRKFPFVLLITLALALMFLLVVLRSVVLPVKAIAMNLLATAATLGLVVVIFQDGHGGRLLDFSSAGFIQAYLPLCMFVLLFGLSMDYEIFLIRRMQEVWRLTGDNRRSVAGGVEHTARPISAAAAIMVAVFGSGMTAHILELKQFGFALAAAIAIDATLIRLVLVPALMCLLGARNWWLPDRLGRILPRLQID